MSSRQVVSGLAGALVLAGTLATDAVAQREERQRQYREWVELGCKEVSFRVDRDILEVGRQEGRFTAIRLYARGGDVELLGLKVFYARGRGEPDEYRVRYVLERGERTRAIDLRGRARSIDSIEMTYRALPNRRDREPRVCVEAAPED